MLEVGIIQRSHFAPPQTFQTISEMPTKLAGMPAYLELLAERDGFGINADRSLQSQVRDHQCNRRSKYGTYVLVQLNAH